MEIKCNRCNRVFDWQDIQYYDLDDEDARYCKHCAFSSSSYINYPQLVTRNPKQLEYDRQQDLNNIKRLTNLNSLFIKQLQEFKQLDIDRVYEYNDLHKRLNK